MSLINDALNKAERDRADNALADAARLTPLARAQKRRQQKEVQSLPLIVMNAAALMVGFAVIILVVLRNRPAATDAPSPIVASPPAEIASAPAIANNSSAPAPSSNPAPLSTGPSPFTPVTDLPHSPAPASPDYELAGMSAMGDNTLLSITRRSDQRSVWIPVGKTVGEITAVSYDEPSDQAVLRIRGQLVTVGLRSGPPPEPSIEAAE